MPGLLHMSLGLRSFSKDWWLIRIGSIAHPSRRLSLLRNSVSPSQSSHPASWRIPAGCPTCWCCGLWKSNRENIWQGSQFSREEYADYFWELLQLEGQLDWSQHRSCCFKSSIHSCVDIFSYPKLNIMVNLRKSMHLRSYSVRFSNSHISPMKTNLFIFEWKPCEEQKDHFRQWFYVRFKQKRWIVAL